MTDSQHTHGLRLKKNPVVRETLTQHLSNLFGHLKKNAIKSTNNTDTILKTV